MNKNAWIWDIHTDIPCCKRYRVFGRYLGVGGPRLKGIYLGHCLRSSISIPSSIRSFSLCAYGIYLDGWNYVRPAMPYNGRSALVSRLLKGYVGGGADKEPRDYSWKWSFENEHKDLSWTRAASICTEEGHSREGSS